MRFEWSNPSSWPNYLGYEPYYDLPAPTGLVDKFKSSYTHIRTFHGCRTEDTNNYYKHGIRLSSYDLLNEGLIALAKSELDIEIPEDKLRAVTARLGSYHEGSCFVVIDKERLLQTAAHYAIYGSERLLAIVNHLESDGVPIDKELLTRTGRPTVLTVDLQVGDLTDADLYALVREINNYIYCKDVSGSLDFTFQLKEPVAPDRVTSHEHPPELKDPFERFAERSFRS